jgi:hypothetical protein
VSSRFFAALRMTPKETGKLFVGRPLIGSTTRICAVNRTVVAVISSAFISTDATGKPGRIAPAATRANDKYGAKESELVHAEERPLRHLLAGDFDSEYIGLELLTCGHGGRSVEIYLH